MESCILIHSGGLDSTVLLYQLLRQDVRVRCLSVDYGQRHFRELEHAARICERLRVERRVAALGQLRELLGGSSQTDRAIAVPEGHYTEESMKATVVPNRNMIMIAVAAAWAMSTKSDAVLYAAHGGDHAIYPDCRPIFASTLDMALQLADWHQVYLRAPFLQMSKADIVRLGAQLGVPFAETWSCYKGEEKHCGKCGTCVERREAFKLAVVDDPTEYV